MSNEAINRLFPEIEARNMARRLPAARRRVAVAREKAARFNTEENRLAVTELEAGLARMEEKVTA